MVAFKKLTSDIKYVQNDIEDYIPSQAGGLIFSSIAKEFPYIETPSKSSVKMADFAEFGYCPYKAWHHGKGTIVKRPTFTEIALVRGSDTHNDILERDIEILKKTPTATESELRDPMSPSE